MNHLPVLIQDLAVILFSAGLITLLFKRLNQPVVLGYLVAGFMAGPHILGNSWISDVENIRIWGDIGVIFLLFALGLEFSFRKLLTVGSTAVIGALTIVVGMMTMGYLTGLLIGWSDMNALFLGGMLAMSSTTIVFKALDEMGLRRQKFASVVFGILIVEDLFAVVLMVLLSTLAISKQIEGIELAQSIAKLIFYLLFWFIGGIFLIPSFLKRIKRYLNDETLLVLSLGLCLGMVILASYAGFSSALGAFVMGSILAETVEAEHIEKLVTSVKNLFGAIFFVSVGMMIDPSLLWQYALPIALITVIVLVGQVFFGSMGVLLSGQPLHVAIRSGFSLAQIGEFAFIIAALGQNLKVTGDFLYPVVVAVSVITTFLTPYMIRFSEPFYERVNQKLSPSLRRLLERYSNGSRPIRQDNAWHRLLRSLVRIVIIYSVSAAFIAFLYLTYISPLILSLIGDVVGRLVSLTGILLIVSPLLRAVMMKKNHSKEFVQLWRDSRYNRGPLVAVILLRVLLCIGFVMFLVARLFTLASGVLLGISLAVIFLFISSRRIKMQSIRLERHFLRNLSAREMEQEKKAPVRRRFVQSLLARDIHLADFEVQPDSPSVGKMLKELDLRRQSGVNIVKIIRGEYHLNIPGGNEHLYPYDKIVVAGTDKQIEAFRQYLEQRRQKSNEQPALLHRDVTLEQFVIEPDSAFVGKSIRDSHIRDKGNCLVIGIERNNSSMMNPESDLCFQAGDLVWVAGERDRLELLLQEDAEKKAPEEWVVVKK